MNTDRIDLVQFHISPSPETLTEHDALDELVTLRDEGKIETDDFRERRTWNVK